MTTFIGLLQAHAPLKGFMNSFRNVENQTGYASEILTPGPY